MLAILWVGYPIEKGAVLAGKAADYDLMILVVIRFGDKDYHNNEKSMLDFLTMVFYPHADRFREKVSRYISPKEVSGEEKTKNMFSIIFR